MEQQQVNAEFRYSNTALFYKSLLGRAWKEYYGDEDDKCRETCLTLLAFPALGYHLQIEAWHLLALTANSRQEARKHVQSALDIIEALELEDENAKSAPSKVLANYRESNAEISEFGATIQQFDSEHVSSPNASSSDKLHEDEDEDKDPDSQPSTKARDSQESIDVAHSSQSALGSSPLKPRIQGLQRQAAENFKPEVDNHESRVKVEEDELLKASAAAKVKRDLEQKAWLKENSEGWEDDEDDDDIDSDDEDD